MLTVASRSRLYVKRWFERPDRVAMDPSVNHPSACGMSLSFWHVVITDAMRDACTLGDFQFEKVNREHQYPVSATSSSPRLGRSSLDIVRLSTLSEEQMRFSLRQIDDGLREY